MNNPYCTCLVALIASLAPAASEAATYYVSPTGNDSNSGTSLTSAFTTLQRAANRAVGGDTVLVANGSYKTSSSALLSLSRGGTSSARITFKSIQKWGAKLDGNGQRSPTGIYVGSGASYITFQDFEVTGFNLLAFSIRGSNIILRGNLIHDIGRICSDSSYGRAGVYASGTSNLVLDKNTFHDIGRFAPGENGCSPTTHYYQNLDHGVYIDAIRNATISNNQFYKLTHGWAVHVYPGATSGLRLTGNTMNGANPWRDGHILIYASLTNSVIENNTMTYPRKEGVSYGSGSMSNVVIRNNITYPVPVTTDRWPSGVTFTNNIIRNPESLVSESSTP